MSNTSFETVGDQAKAAAAQVVDAPADIASPKPAFVPAEPRDLPASPGGPIPGLVGDYGSKDAKIEYLSLVSGNSNLIEQFDSGEWVMGRTVPLGRELDVVFAEIKKTFEERPPPGVPVIGFDARVWPTELEATESGKPYVAKAECLLLVKAPEHLAADTWGATGRIPVWFTLRGSSYDAHAGGYGQIIPVVVRDAQKGWLNGDLLRGAYKLGSVPKVYQGKNYLRAIVTVIGELTPTERGAIRTEFGR